MENLAVATAHDSDHAARTSERQTTAAAASPASPRWRRSRGLLSTTYWRPRSLTSLSVDSSVHALTLLSVDSSVHALGESARAASAPVEELAGQPSPTNPQRGGPSVSLVIPTLNEAGNIGWVLDRVPAGVDEVVVVDGHSTDDTAGVVRRHPLDVQFIEQDGPGKGAALRAGFAAASGDIIVMLDADGSMAPGEIDRFVYFLENGYDLVKGSRFISGGGSLDITRLRCIGNKSLVTLANMLCGAGMTDLCYGFVAFYRRHLRALALSADGFEIETQITINALRAGLRVAEVPSVELQRRHGTSNLNTVRDGRRVLQMLLESATRRPSRSPLSPVSAAGDVVVDPTALKAS